MRGLGMDWLTSCLEIGEESRTLVDVAEFFLNRIDYSGL